MVILHITSYKLLVCNGTGGITSIYTYVLTDYRITSTYTYRLYRVNVVW